jgi:hypothetical protein
LTLSGSAATTTLTIPTTRAASLSVLSGTDPWAPGGGTLLLGLGAAAMWALRRRSPVVGRVGLPSLLAGAVAFGGCGGGNGGSGSTPEGSYTVDIKE